MNRQFKRWIEKYKYELRPKGELGKATSPEGTLVEFTHSRYAGTMFISAGWDAKAKLPFVKVYDEFDQSESYEYGRDD